MADKFLGVAIGGELPVEVTIADSTTSASIELRVALGTTGPAMTQLDLLNAVDAIRDKLIQAPFPVA